MHTDIDELERVSLERLAEIKPSLLDQIHSIAEQILSSGGGGDRGGTSVGGGKTKGNEAAPTSSSPTTTTSNLPPPYTETRHDSEIQRTQEWDSLTIDYTEKAHDIIGSLQHSVRLGGSAGEGLTMTFENDDGGANSDDAADAKNKMIMTDLLSSASVAANHLTFVMQHLRSVEEASASSKKKNHGVAAQQRRAAALGAGPPRTCLSVDKTKFTTEGLKERNDMVVALLYDAGLPFVSSSDGRRFATQIELSNHLDALFRRSQIEKTMERTEERGWYDTESLWTKLETAKPENMEDATSTSQNTTEEATPETSTVFADESRDRCVVCGINFEMFFDQEEGEYKYRNCKEVKAVGGDGNGEEDVLVHVTCLRGLGSPEVLMMHQILHKH
uniref:PCFS4-like zinc finger domain-containing protein n=1 Tax=Helicotheca tamesis TaxID=374047 RepID=A0A7S2I3V0_9STRA